MRGSAPRLHWGAYSTLAASSQENSTLAFSLSGLAYRADLTPPTITILTTSLAVADT